MNELLKSFNTLDIYEKKEEIIEQLNIMYKVFYNINCGENKVSIDDFKDEFYDLTTDEYLNLLFSKITSIKEVATEMIKKNFNI